MQVIERFGSGLHAPRSPVHHYYKDGPMRFFDNNATNPDADYEPNSFNAHGHAVCNGRDRKKQSKFKNLGVEYLGTNQGVVGLNPTARSTSQTVGMWREIPSLVPD
jgi:catalase